MANDIKISSGADRGNLKITHGHSKRLIESQPYDRDAEKVFEFLGETLCSQTFDCLCMLAEKRSIRRELFMKRRHLPRKTTF